ncbi:trypsin-like serine protease [Mucisphaera calidilacus]|uniref:Putative peptidase n=1 Tax=Mucisphaera calidilacus TaxID=2527982 RepID=A0A518BZ35_9BACT|nr:trypsin-like serine protease [Mucisphaera calidilacus]QDU72242.1 putative peptidase precursor [Mucisphaera calidilacus]
MHAYTTTSLLVATLTASSSLAISIRDDRSEISHIQLAEQADYDAVGEIFATVAGLGTSACSATLITDQWALTAAHCIDGNDLRGNGVSHLRFLVEGQLRYVKQWIPHPQWADTDGSFTAGYDIGLIQLSTPITSVEPAPLFEQRVTPGQESVAVGYGIPGTGSTGTDQSADFGTKRAAVNSIDAMGAENFPFPLGFTLIEDWSSNIIATDFDEPGNPDASSIGSPFPLNLEGAITSGDSGGALFVTSNNQQQLAAVNSFSASFDDDPDGSYSDLSGFSRVWPHLDWIGYTILTESEAPGDYTSDGRIDDADIDFLFAEFNNPYITPANQFTIPNIELVLGTIADPRYDLTGDNKTNHADLHFLVNDLIGTTFGDLDLDGTVNLVDLSTLAENFGATDASWSQGDADGNGTVDLIDLSMLAPNFDTSPVPEPATLLPLLAILATRRRA